MSKDKELHITYIGRLEKEKGIEIVIACIKKWLLEKKNIIWHICGNGTYQSELEILSHDVLLNQWNSSHINIYGHVDQKKMTEILSITDLVFMPSLFLETFGLVALETLSSGVPVCGFARGGLREFIHPRLDLEVWDPVLSFFHILDAWIFPMVNVSDFSQDQWISKLRELTLWIDRVLLVNDYLDTVGWAEQYFHSLREALRSIWKTVEVFWYIWKINRFKRIWLMLLSPIAFWRGIALHKKIHEFSPDLIWMHSVLRYIGPHWIRAISDSWSKKYITHHDLGLITARPSRIYDEWDIPSSPNLGDWIPKKLSIVSILSILPKWSITQYIWSFLQKDTVTHILPSSWMQPYFHKYVDTIPVIFPHTTTIDHAVKQ